MKYIESYDLRDSISRTYFILLCFLPVLIIGLLAFVLFASFLGTQANEIARLVRDLELQCEFEAGLRDVGVTGIRCADYLPRIGFFFFLLIAWTVAATVTTIKIFEFAKSRLLRLTITIITALSIPVLLLLKYFLAIGSLSTFLYAILALIGISIFIIGFSFSTVARLIQNSTIMSFVFVFSAITFLVLSILFSYYDKNIFSALGSLNTILLSIIIIYTFAGGLFYFSRTTGIPWVTGLFIWIVTLNIFGWNDRAPVHLRPVTPAAAVTGDAQFLQWLDARQDRAVYENSGRDYPVYIVAAAGGGTYASIRTAYMLTYLQKICPAFAHHLFAVSSVSGGGLGAIAYASQNITFDPQDLRACEGLETRQVVASPVETVIAPEAPSPLDSFFAKDVLSTIVGAGLFPDMLQRAIPWPVRQLDRSVAYGEALAQYWREALGAEDSRRADASKIQAMGCPAEEFFGECEIASYWRPDGNVPILIFNTTDVDTGTPIILSNLSKEFYQGTLAAVNMRDFTDKSIYLIDGASLSARFPIALPAGFLPQSTSSDSWFRLVDGGYFDTSGLITAEAVKKRIEKIASDRGLRVSVRLIFLGEWADRAPEAVDAPSAPQPSAPAAIIAQLSASVKNGHGKSPGGSELDAHAAALFTARDQRTNFLVSRFLATIDGTIALRWDPQAQGGLTPHCPDVPLAWYLAPCTQQLARSRLDDALFAAEPELAKLRGDLAR